MQSKLNQLNSLVWLALEVIHEGHCYWIDTILANVFNRIFGAPVLAGSAPFIINPIPVYLIGHHSSVWIFTISLSRVFLILLAFLKIYIKFCLAPLFVMWICNMYLKASVARCFSGVPLPFQPINMQVYKLGWLVIMKSSCTPQGTANLDSNGTYDR